MVMVSCAALLLYFSLEVRASTDTEESCEWPTCTHGYPFCHNRSVGHCYTTYILGNTSQSDGCNDGNAQCDIGACMCEEGWCAGPNQDLCIATPKNAGAKASDASFEHTFPVHALQFVEKECPWTGTFICFLIPASVSLVLICEVLNCGCFKGKNDGHQACDCCGPPENPQDHVAVSLCVLKLWPSQQPSDLQIKKPSEFCLGTLAIIILLLSSFVLADRWHTSNAFWKEHQRFFKEFHQDLTEIEDHLNETAGIVLGLTNSFHEMQKCRATNPVMASAGDAAIEQMQIQLDVYEGSHGSLSLLADVSATLELTVEQFQKMYHLIDGAERFLQDWYRWWVPAIPILLTIGMCFVMMVAAVGLGHGCQNYRALAAALFMTMFIFIILLLAFSMSAPLTLQWDILHVEFCHGVDETLLSYTPSGFQKDYLRSIIKGGNHSNNVVEEIWKARDILESIGVALEFYHPILRSQYPSCAGLKGLHRKPIYEARHILAGVSDMVSAGNMWKYYNYFVHMSACGYLLKQEVNMDTLNMIFVLVFFPVVTMYCHRYLVSFLLWNGAKDGFLVRSQVDKFLTDSDTSSSDSRGSI